METKQKASQLAESADSRGSVKASSIKQTRDELEKIHMDWREASKSRRKTSLTNEHGKTYQQD